MLLLNDYEFNQWNLFTFIGNSCWRKIYLTVPKYNYTCDILTILSMSEHKEGHVLLLERKHFSYIFTEHKCNNDWLKQWNRYILTDMEQRSEWKPYLVGGHGCHCISDLASAKSNEKIEDWNTYNVNVMNWFQLS